MPTYIRRKRSPGFGSRPFSRGGWAGARSVRRRLFKGYGIRTRGRIFRTGWAGVASGVASNLALGYHVNSTGMRRLKARRQVGLRVGSSNCKSDELQPGNENNATKVLNRTTRLLALTRNNDSDDRSSRLQDSVDFRGVKICFRVKISESVDAAGKGGSKFAFNWAIISPKAAGDKLTAIPNEEFFRGSGEQSRSQDCSVTLTGLDLHCVPINKVKYIIQRHKRCIMGPYESTEGKAEKYFETYLPVKRKIVYNNSGSPLEQTYPIGKDMWMIWWGSFLDEGAGQGVTPAYTTQYKAVKYFREPKSS